MNVTNVPLATKVVRRERPGIGGRSFASVVHVTEKGGSFGGTEEYIALVTAALAADGVRSSLVCGVVTGTLSAELDEVRIVPGLAARELHADTARAVADAVAELDADIIYVHNIFDPAVVPTLSALDGRGVLLWYVHDHYLTCLSELRWRRDLGSCAQRLGHDCLDAITDGRCVMRHPDRVHVGADVERRAALQRSLGAADAVIVVSDYMRSLLHDAQPDLADYLHVLTRPIRDLGSLRPRHRTLADDPAVVTYAGRITTEKGLAVVIEALGAMAATAPVELRIAGVVEDDQYWTRCRQLLTRSMATNRRLTAVYLGHLDYREMDQLLRKSDIVTIPSRWPEPLGAVALEAMAAGAAVIASSVGGLGGILANDRNGIHAVAGDVGSWRDALTALLDHPGQARRLGEQGHRESARTGIADHLRDLDALVDAQGRGSKPPNRASRIAS
ncbi:MAG: glycosyltransferase family 4 protein [Ilumatobacteraceae bacterium]